MTFSEPEATPTLALPAPDEVTFWPAAGGFLVLLAEAFRFFSSGSTMQAPGWGGSGGRSLRGAGGGSLRGRGPGGVEEVGGVSSD